ncbi:MULTISPECIES: flavodoxin domain-containing protein [unclassified Fusibacter]|uniref:flavodoxin domain-containing protein n=1 Tax=unclassified Fusibacter TaxID=2624464 RepID=UPI0013E9131D|nr:MULTISPECIES: flavodoxin domain-containing protein [unclassified Fusibacter]MCK8058998.1 flavodoxin domain-containing protein [Fusibacter sp. A2]NPE22409.1 hypothetical protein [Fusibacter sp. A1]
MKTVLLYSSKYGTTKKCAELLAQKLIQCTLVSLDAQPDFDVSDYQNIIIGTSVYAGQIRKPVKTYLTNHVDLLKSKHVSYYFCCNDTTDHFNLVPDQLKTESTIVTQFGFELNQSKMNFFDRLVTKMIAKTSETVSVIKFEAIDAFAKKVELASNQAV